METKKTYTTPQVELIFLDNEISLALESSPPEGPDEGALISPEFMHNDPYRNNMG
jgi:hypothetical protein